MSGLEIAGVVLGALSLTTEALDHYKAGRGDVATIIKWKGLIGVILADHDTQQCLLHTHLKILLYGAGITDAKSFDVATCVDTLVSEGTRSLVEHHLSAATPTFYAILRRYQEGLASLVNTIFGATTNSSVAFDIEGLADIRDKKKSPQVLARIHYLISRSKVDLLLKTLSKEMKNIGDIVSGADKLNEDLADQGYEDDHGRKLHLLRSRHRELELLLQLLDECGTEDCTEAHDLHEVLINLKGCDGDNHLSRCPVRRDRIHIEFVVRLQGTEGLHLALSLQVVVHVSDASLQMTTLSGATVRDVKSN